MTRKTAFGLSPVPGAPARQVPTLEDVARRAGVSTATVSRCLNAPDRVVEETRTRVMQAVEDLGYAPNFGARALVQKRTDTFGAIIPTMENAIFARGLQAFQEALAKDGVMTLVASSSYRPELEAEQIRALVARGADALLFIGHDRAPEIYDFLDRRRIPYVVAWAHDPDAGRPSIGFDNRRAMERLAAEVIAEGHRRLAVISAETASNDRARARLAGVRDAMAKAGLDPASLVVETAPYAIGAGAAAMLRLISRRDRPTAVLCGNDVLAVGALRAALAAGLSVPGDVSITGFDDIELAGIVTPALTSVHVPHREMGRGAARILLALRNGERPETPVELEARIIHRDTLGPVPSS